MRYKEMMQRRFIRRSQRMYQDKYWFIYGLTPVHGRREPVPVVDGAFATREEANRKGMKIFGNNDFQLEELPTRNLATAKSMLKSKLAELYGDLASALQPMYQYKGEE